MSEQTSSGWAGDDAMAIQSGAVSEDAQPVTTPEDSDKTAQGSLAGTAGPEGREKADSLETEPASDE